MMIICQRCGSSLPDTASFCGTCGNLVSGTLAPSQANPGDSTNTKTTGGRPITTSSAIDAGSHLQNGRYTIKQILGQGGMGAALLANDARLDNKPVVIKELISDNVDPVQHTDDVRNFKREVSTLARIDHPLVPIVTDHFQEGMRSFMVQEYIEGENLEAYIERLQKPLSEREVLVCADEILDVLDYLSQQTPPIVHRDIKPANIIIGKKDHRAHLVDFGIARADELKNAQRKQTSALGTPGYAPPEQYQGNSDQRSDLYALAATLHHLLTNRDPREYAPFFYPPARTLNNQVIPDIEVILQKALNNDITQRYQSAQEMKQDIDKVLRQRSRSPMQKSIHVFISYARRDQNLRDQLENHLSNLKYRGLITTWTAEEIGAGEEIIQQVNVHLHTAQIILLLISANFLASEYCYSQDMMQAVQRHERGDAHIIPVLLRPVLFKDAPFARLRPLPTNGKPVVNWRNRDSAFVDIAIGIEHVVQNRLASLPFQATTNAQQLAPLRERVGQPSLRMRTPLRRWRGLIFVGLSLLGFGCASLLLTQHPNLTPLVGVIAGSLVFLAGIFLTIRALVKRAQFRDDQRREQEETRRRELEAARIREQEEIRRREREEIQRQEQERVYYGKALRAYEQALRQDNADVIAYRGKGNALAGLKRYNEALIAYEQALVLAPLAATYVNKGHILTALGRYDEAVTTYEQALALDASYAAYEGMGLALSQLGRMQEAEQSYQQAEQLGDDG